MHIYKIIRAYDIYNLTRLCDIYNLFYNNPTVYFYVYD